MVDAEPHAGHEMGGHNPEQDNIRRRFLVVSRHQYIKKSGLVIGLAITHNHIQNDPFRFYVLDYSSKTNGDALLFQMLTYDFIARHGKVIGHIQPSTKFDNLLKQVQNIFLKE
ncbi:type II toxin-antitoxin system PemK/MazF family toxin [Lactobacillus intestinalis]|uniref:Type II toxin-antitoxin system PemK/MazF family toxin n=2 Tax=Lactobacillus intestinalis TaxID=151781 RepID=A0A4S2BCP2_9LACO|nr:type II toxin-antitoxin system PemK/MazF family toxin [Lactobacillus intestinalis]